MELFEHVIETSKISFFADTREMLYRKIEAFCRMNHVYAVHIIFDRDYELKTKGAKAYVKFAEVGK